MNNFLASLDLGQSSMFILLFVCDKQRKLIKFQYIAQMEQETYMVQNKVNT